jgi:GNAT superfamily N-acetyltransferase
VQTITTEYREYTITTDKSLMKVHDVHQWLSEESYWCRNIPFVTFKKSFDNSFAIGVLYNGKQVGYACLTTDYATFAYLKDVFVTEEHRGKGISKKMLEILFDIDWVKGLRVIKLATKDAHPLYERYGFTICQNPERVMEIVRKDIYYTVKSR